MIRKLQAGMMPPPGAPRPDAGDATRRCIRALETTVDARAAAKPNPGGRTFQRLNRPEYARAVRDLLGARRRRRRLAAARHEERELRQHRRRAGAVADAARGVPERGRRRSAAWRSATATRRRSITTYTNPSYVSQHPWDHVEGAPYGTRGGMVVDHVFPADGEYVFEVDVQRAATNARFEDIDISIDGERVALLEYETGPAGGADGRGATPLRTEPILVKAGQQHGRGGVRAQLDGPYEDLIRPHDWSFAGGGSGGGGITTLPHLRDVIDHGPVQDRPAFPRRRAAQKIFTCRPTVAGRRARRARGRSSRASAARRIAVR